MRILKSLCLPLFMVHALFTVPLAQAATSAAENWSPFNAANGSAQPRHESGAVMVAGKLYLLGGRGMPVVQMFDPATSSWSNLGPTPLEMHHFQPVAIDENIYVIGSFTCCYPDETSVADIHVFNTNSNTWSIAGSMPASRLRGSAATVVREGIIYVLGGNTQGHSGGAVAWFDSYNPDTGVWKTLADAPNARDHFAAVLVNDYLVAAAGRQTALPNPFKNAVAVTDMYDFVTQSWTSVDAIPSLRAGALAAAAGDEIIVAGGEINTSTIALAKVEAMNVYSGTWRTLQPLGMGRHSGGGVVFGSRFHVLAGSLNTGGAPETGTHESLLIDETKNLDFDADGLSNDDERRVHGTNPTNADTDADNVSDAAEVNQHGSNPLLSDTDADGIEDGVELNSLNTSPISDDTDSDGLSDYAEVYEHTTNPLKADSDEDGLNDAAELQQYFSDPANEDSDADGLLDGAEVQQGLDPNDADTDNDGIVDGEDDTPGGTTTEPPITEPSPEPMPEPTIEPTPTVGNNTGSSSGNVSMMFLGALLVGRLSRYRLKRVNVSAKNANS